jgi:hypothetical protein
MTKEIQKNFSGITYTIDQELVDKLQTKNIDAIAEIEAAIEAHRKIYQERISSEGQGTKE